MEVRSPKLVSSEDRTGARAPSASYCSTEGVAPLHTAPPVPVDCATSAGTAAYLARYTHPCCLPCQVQLPTLPGTAAYLARYTHPCCLPCKVQLPTLPGTLTLAAYLARYSCLSCQVHLPRLSAWLSHLHVPQYTTLHCTKSNLCIPRKGIAQLSPNFYIHVPVSDLYIPGIGPHIWL